MRRWTVAEYLTAVEQSYKGSKIALLFDRAYEESIISCHYSPVLQQLQHCFAVGRSYKNSSIALMIELLAGSFVGGAV